MFVQHMVGSAAGCGTGAGHLDSHPVKKPNEPLVSRGLLPRVAMMAPLC